MYRNDGGLLRYMTQKRGMLFKQRLSHTECHSGHRIYVNYQLKCKYCGSVKWCHCVLYSAVRMSRYAPK